MAPITGLQTENVKQSPNKPDKYKYRNIHTKIAGELRGDVEGHRCWDAAEKSGDGIKVRNCKHIYVTFRNIQVWYFKEILRRETVTFGVFKKFSGKKQWNVIFERYFSGKIQSKWNFQDILRKETVKYGTFNPIEQFLICLLLSTLAIGSPVMTISETGGNWTVLTKTTAKTTEVKFRLEIWNGWGWWTTG